MDIESVTSFWRSCKDVSLSTACWSFWVSVSTSWVLLFLCCLPPKETCYLLRCQVFVYFKHWFATCESRLSHGFRHRYRNRLNPTFTMAGHFFKHSTSTIRTKTPPNTEVWSMNGTNIEKSSISFGVSKMSARDKIRSTSFSRSENLQLRKWLEMYFLQLWKGTTWDMQVRSPPDN